jgi:hypothetical protein
LELSNFSSGQLRDQTSDADARRERNTDQEKARPYEWAFRVFTVRSGFIMI